MVEEAKQSTDSIQEDRGGSQSASRSHLAYSSLWVTVLASCHSGFKVRKFLMKMRLPFTPSQSLSPPDSLSPAL